MNRNLIIGLGVVLVIFLALLALRITMFPDSTPGEGLIPWRTGPGMGPGMMYGPTQNYSFGPGMMYGYGNMMALYYPEAKPIDLQEALQAMEALAEQYGTGLEVNDFMAFSSNYYAALKEPSTGQSIAEIIVDRYSGSAYPEPGPNMMWNTRFGSGRSRTGGVIYGQGAASGLAEDFLEGYLPGAQIIETKAFPGYYTFDFGRDGIEGMLSVNAYSGEIWIHTWHGFYLKEQNTTV